MDELEKLKQELAELETLNSKNNEVLLIKSKIANLKNKQQQLQFRNKHPTLLNITGSLERGFKRFTSGIVALINRAGNNLQPSKNIPSKDNANQKAKKDSIKDALEVLD